MNRSRTIANVPDEAWDTFRKITGRDGMYSNYSCFGQANYFRYLLRLDAEVRRQGIRVEFTSATEDIA